MVLVLLRPKVRNRQLLSWSMNTEVDLEGRKNGFDPEEVAELEKEKKAQETPPPGIGPDFMPTGIRYRSPV